MFAVLLHKAQQTVKAEASDKVTMEMIRCGAAKRAQQVPPTFIYHLLKWYVVPHRLPLLLPLNIPITECDWNIKCLQNHETTGKSWDTTQVFIMVFLSSNNESMDSEHWTELLIII